MLLNHNTFLLQYGIRTALKMTDPPITLSDEIGLPRLAVLHYLNPENNNHFPARTLHYFKGISDNKKIPVYSLTDLTYTLDTSTLLNRKVQQELKKWHHDNLKVFKNVNLLEDANADNNVISVFNYNLLIDMYKYKTSPMSNYYKYTNLYTTYWDNVKKAIAKDTLSNHFVRINLPNAIPSYNVMLTLNKFNPVKFSRVVNMWQLGGVFDLFRWLNDDTRNLSCMKNITDEESLRVVIEFTYKGYSLYLPLYILRAICKQSKLESKTKIPEAKVLKFFMLFILKSQTKITTIIEALEKELAKDEPEKKSNDNDASEVAIKDSNTVIDGTSNSSDNINHTSVSTSTPSINKHQETNKISPLKNDIDVVNNALEQSDISNLIDNAFKSEEDDETIDNLYMDAISKISSETPSEDNDDESSIKILNDEQIEKLLTDKNFTEQTEEFLNHAVSNQLLNAAEIRAFKKLVTERQTLSSPYISNETGKEELIDTFKVLKEEDISLTPEEIELPVTNDLVSNFLKKEVVANFDKKYIKKTLKKDVVSCVTHLEKSGVVIKDYKIDKHSSITGEYELHQLTVKPFNGKESTVYFRLPVLNEEGVFTNNGISMKMRKQKTD